MRAVHTRHCRAGPSHVGSIPLTRFSAPLPLRLAVASRRAAARWPLCMRPSSALRRWRRCSVPACLKTLRNGPLHPTCSRFCPSCPQASVPPACLACLPVTPWRRSMQPRKRLLSALRPHPQQVQPQPQRRQHRAAGRRRAQRRQPPPCRNGSALACRRARLNRCSARWHLAMAAAAAAASPLLEPAAAAWRAQQHRQNAPPASTQHPAVLLSPPRLAPPAWRRRLRHLRHPAPPPPARRVMLRRMPPAAPPIRAAQQYLALPYLASWRLRVH